MRTRIAALVLLLTAAGVAQPTSLNAGDKLSLRVSPSVSHAPAEVVVTATVERDADNRSLEVIAESDDFYRSSLIALEGDQAPRTTQLRLKNLPGGEYAVAVVLRGSHGERTLASRTIVVMPSLGER